MKRFLESRAALYLVGLFIGLVAMVLIFQAKRAFMPNFHEVVERRPALSIAAGGVLHLRYPVAEPGHLLIWGMPTRLLVFHREADGTFAPRFRLGYGELTEKEVLIGPFAEAGDYVVEGDFFICAAPGVADCSKLILSESVKVGEPGATRESEIAIDLAKYAQAGLAAGPKQY